MSAIITPELVRRYLRATGWTDTGEDYAATDGTRIDKRDNLIACVARVEKTSVTKVSARLGMLAAAEDQYAEARELLKRSDDLGPWAAGRMSAIADAWCWKAGVDPKAWEAAR